MNSNIGSSAANNLLSQLLSQFDQIDKEELAHQVVQSLRLDQDGDSYSAQVSRLLNRNLTDDEEFKLDILDRILNFHSGEESEEEEE